MKRIFYAAAALVMLLTVGVPLWTVVPKESKATFFNIFDGGVNLDPRKSLPGTESTSTTVPPKATIPSAPQGPAGENPDAFGDLPDPEIGLVIVADTHENTYARNSFDYWSYLEADLNDWDTRDQALYEQGRGLEYAGDGRDRTIASGFWADTYGDGRFAAAEFDDVAVDQIVSPEEAWVSGAWAWTDDKRTEFANDLGDIHKTDAGNLFVVPVSTVKEKAGQDMAGWMPATSPAATCWYARQVKRVKQRWELTIDRDEAYVFREVLNGCGGWPDTPVRRY
jgi:hypothetical protein